MTHFFVGVDLGQRRDHTAIAVVEQSRGELLVRFLMRVPLGTPYPIVVDLVREVTAHEQLAGRCVAVVDATGVGAPVVDMLRNARLGCEVVPVTITGGDKESGSHLGWSVPKKDLIAGVQVALERGELKIAKELKDAGALMRELGDMRMERHASGKVRMGADGAGQHDDLVIALALAIWKAAKGPVKRNFFGTQRLPGIS